MTVAMRNVLSPLAVYLYNLAASSFCQKRLESCRALLSNLVFLVMLVTGGSVSLAGQAFTGTVSGLISDPTNAPIEDVRVTVTDLAKNTQFNTSTNGSGFYVLPSLPPGQYQITAEKPGFRTYVLGKLTLTIQQKIELNISLQLGSVLQQVNVSAAEELLEPNSSALSTVVENKRIVDLPLNDRNILQLATLVPGVVGRSPSAQPSSMQFLNNTFMINGGQDESSEIMLDGMSTLLPDSPGLLTLSAVPSVEGVQEFRIQTNLYTAEYGRSGGGIITLATKSGTNELHGSAFEFFRDSVMDANEWAANQAGIPLASFTRNQFGASLGGPVFLPRLYNGHNRTFFFFVYDGERAQSATTGQFSVPTPLQRSGDFSQTYNANGQLEAIYNPFSSRSDPSSPGSYVRDPFPGNRIPASFLNPVALNAQKYYPAANNPGLPFTNADNLTIQTTLPQPIDRIEPRIDHYFNDRQRLFGRYTFQETVAADPNYWNSPAMPFNGDLSQKFQNAMIAYNQTFGNSTVLELRGGFGRLFGNRLPPSFDQTQLGFPPSIAANAQELVFPTFSIANMTQLGPKGVRSGWTARLLTIQSPTSRRFKAATV